MSALPRYSSLRPISGAPAAPRTIALPALLLLLALPLGACPTASDVDGDGWTEEEGDCNDDEPTVFPDAPELCDGVDGNCDGDVDSEFDLDGDGYRDAYYCAGLGGDDCDDEDAATHPGATEICNEIDDDCNGTVDDGFDADGDGVSACAGDCDDADAGNFPGNPETCDGEDQDCDGTVDNGSDEDGDGVTSCGPDGEASTADDDCDDTEASVNPSATELCNGVDDDCDGGVDEGFDTDGDAVTTCGPDGEDGTDDDDCDDAASAVNPGATEICNAVDDDCEGGVDEGFDGDADGFTTCGADGAAGGGDDDCDDADSSINPDASEVCDGIDNDCDTFVDGSDDNYAGDDADGDGDEAVACGGDDCDDADAAVDGLDTDQDGETSCDGDCDDGTPYVHGEAAESCDGVDNNCDGDTDEADLDDYGTDQDGDGFTTAGCGNGGSDCDDNDPHVFPESLYTSGPEPQCLPAVYPGFSFEWHASRLFEPSIFEDPADGTLYLFFSGNDSGTQRGIGYVASSDGGETWGEPVGPLVLPGTGGAWDARELIHPSVVYLAGALRPYAVFYGARDDASSGTPNRRQIGMATAETVAGPWEKVDSAGVALTAPVLAVNPGGGTLDSERVLDPAVYVDALGELVMWYAGRASSPSTQRIFRATSSDGVTWTRDDTGAAGSPDPMLEPSDAWEGTLVNSPSWLENPDASGEEFDFWYTGNNDGIGYATGPVDGAWTRSPVNPALTVSSDANRFDGEQVKGLGVLYDALDDAYRMFYRGGTLASNESGDPDFDPIYGNDDGQADYIGLAINHAPQITVNPVATPGSDVTLDGSISDSAPDQVTISISSDLDGDLGTADVTPTGNSDAGRQSTAWSLSITGLSSGTHTLTACAEDEGGLLRCGSAVPFVVP